MIIQNKKTIELRTWNTNFRGEFLVHAPIKIRKEECRKLKMEQKFTTGAIIGKAELCDVKKYESLKEIQADKNKHFSSTTFHEKTFGFILRNAKTFRVPISWKGQLGFFDADLPKMKIEDDKIVTDMIEEEFSYQWVGHH